MKIIHFCLSCFYIDGYRYQENELVRQHVAEGHDVLVVASTETYIDNVKLGYLEPGQYVGSDGAKVIRLPYTRWLPFWLKKKLRMHPGVASILRSETPDVIMFHGLCGWELLTAAKYKRAMPDTLFYADSHEDFNNSARGIFSKYILHYLYYKTIVRWSLNEIDKVLCVSLDTLDFCRDFYRIPAEKLEFYPLGGQILDDSKYLEVRAKAREAMGVRADHLVFLQSGKFDQKKRLIESLRAFSETRNDKFKFIVLGKISDEILKEATELIARDVRIEYLGWKHSDELYDLLCGADVYVQPGSQSATMQMSLCARCAVVLADAPSHMPFVDGNGWKVAGHDSLVSVFKLIDASPGQISDMQEKSYEIALKLLDYENLAKRILA